MKLIRVTYRATFQQPLQGPLNPMGCKIGGPMFVEVYQATSGEMERPDDGIQRPLAHPTRQHIRPDESQRRSLLRNDVDAMAHVGQTVNNETNAASAARRGRNPKHRSGLLQRPTRGDETMTPHRYEPRPAYCRSCNMAPTDPGFLAAHPSESFHPDPVAKSAPAEPSPAARHIDTPDELLNLLAGISSDPQVEGLSLSQKASTIALLHIAKALQQIADSGEISDAILIAAGKTDQL